MYGFASLASIAAGGAELLPPGNRAVPPGVHALVGGRVVVKPGQSLDGATVVIRDGLIQSVGTNLTPPPEARVWDMKGLNIYAGFIDPYVIMGSNAPSASREREDGLRAGKFYGLPVAKTDPGNPGPGSELSAITPERREAEGVSPDPKFLAAMRELGITVRIGAVLHLMGGNAKRLKARLDRGPLERAGPVGD